MDGNCERQETRRSYATGLGNADIILIKGLKLTDPFTDARAEDSGSEHLPKVSSGLLSQK